ncbi:MAG: hypothetical protein J1F69_02235 [Clostridiales bacterium]|nr:hypothetical protein [Clostridiales bacterium]
MKILRHNSRVNKTNKQIVTVLLTVCVLFAYWFLFFDNNADLEENTTTKIAAVIYPFALLIVGVLLGRFNNKTGALLLIVAVYLFINYLIFGKGIKNDFIILFVIMAFVVSRNFYFSSKYAKPILVLSLILCAVIVLVGSFSGFYYVSEVFGDMHINSNTMSQLVLANMFIALSLTKKNKLTPIAVFIYIIGLLLLFYCKSRNAMLCGIVLCVGHLFMNKVKTSTMYKLFVFAMAMTLVVILLYAYLLPQLVSSDYVIFGKRLFTGRQRIYADAFEQIFSSPVTVMFGCGFISFGQNSSIYLNSHNFWLQLWIQYGIFMMLLVLILFIKLVRSYRSQPSAESNLYITYCICLVLLCMFESPLTGRTMSVLLIIPLILRRKSVVNRARKRKNAANMTASRPNTQHNLKKAGGY